MNQTYMRAAVDILRAFEAAQHDADIIGLIYEALQTADQNGYEQRMDDEIDEREERERFVVANTDFVVTPDGEVAVYVPNEDVRAPRVNACVEGFEFPPSMSLDYASQR